MISGGISMHTVHIEVILGVTLIWVRTKGPDYLS